MLAQIAKSRKFRSRDHSCSFVIWARMENPGNIVLAQNREGKFVTSMGKPVGWFNWNRNGSGQPDNYRNEDYVHMRGNDGTWNDIGQDSDVSADITVFCEFKIVSGK